MVFPCTVLKEAVKNIKVIKFCNLNPYYFNILHEKNGKYPDSTSAAQKTELRELFQRTALG